ncbi:MAG: hypothetical protein EXQ89_04750 [Rhodospirillaceae bacterium]|nr:hypothetical protein [Rhodospirillaceae bacterium]
MNWLEIVSPTLKHHHKNWVGLRGQGLLPAMATYKNFTEFVPTNDAVPVAVADWNPAIMYEQGLLEAKATARASGEKLRIWRQPSGFLVIGE